MISSKFSKYVYNAADDTPLALASAFIPVDGASEQELADAAQLSSLADETPEGRSVVILAKEKFNIRGR